jgi:hypothetical protein
MSYFIRVFGLSLATVGALAVSSSLHASDFHSARTAGLGGAGHAAPILTDAIYMNPAMISFLSAYSIGATWNSYSGPNDSEPNGHLANLSIQDGTNSIFQAGLGYTRKAYGKQVSIGASTRLFERYGIGVGGKFLFGSGSRESAQDTIVSFLASPFRWLQASVIADNIIQGDKTKQWGLRREYILGLKANIEGILILYFDPHLAPNDVESSYGYELGAELPLMGDLYIRGGVNRNSFQPHLGTYGDGHSIGIGVVFPRLSLDAAMIKSKEPIRTNNWTVSITII